VGDSPTIVDAYAFPMLRWAQVKLPEKLDNTPNLQRLHDALAADSGVQKVMKNEGIE